MTKLYRTRGLEWTDSAVGFTAIGFGVMYSVFKHPSTGIIEYRMFGDRHSGKVDETDRCESYEQGKQFCQDHFNKFMEKGLEVITDGK